MKPITYKQILWLITYTVLLFAILMNFQSVIDACNAILFVLQPLLIGILLALAMDCLATYLETKLFTKATPRGARVLSVVVAVLLILLIIAALLWFSVPSIVRSLGQLIENIPNYLDTALQYIDSLAENFGLNTTPSDALLSDWSSMQKALTDSMSTIVLTLYGFTQSVVRMLLGFVFSIYVLLDKKRIKLMMQRALHVIPQKADVGDKIYGYIELCAVTFKSFIAGQILDAVVLGFLCFIGMIVIGLPYAPVISVLIGVTAIIPIIGPYVGAILSALLLLLENPVQALVFLIYIIALQQLEGAVIYPKVVGNSIGIDGLFVFVGVTLGAGLGGVWGLLLGVPFVAVLYAVLAKWLQAREKDLEKNSDATKSKSTNSKNNSRI